MEISQVSLAFNHTRNYESTSVCVYGDFWGVTSETFEPKFTKTINRLPMPDILHSTFQVKENDAKLT